MTRILLPLFLLLFTASAWCETHFRPTAWLLVGLNDFEGTQPLGEDLRLGESREGQLRRLFKHSLKGLGLKLKTKMKATQNDLYRVTQDPNTVAIFWISHGRSFARGLTAPPGLLVDSEGSDLAPLFRDLHPNTRYVALIGCQSDALLQAYKRRGCYDSHPFLKFGAFQDSDLAEPTTGLMRELTAARLWLSSQPRVMRCRPQQGLIRIRVARLTNTPSHTVKQAPAARIELRGRVLGVLPALKAGQVQSAEVWIKPEELERYRPMDIEVIASSRREPGEGLGEFTFQTEDPCLSWIQLKPQRTASPDLLRAVYTLKTSCSTVNPQLGRGPC